MDSSRPNLPSTASVVLDKIEALIEQQDFATALREIRTLEATCRVGISAGDLGRLYLSAAEVLYHGGQYPDALHYAGLAIESFKHTDAHVSYGRAKCRRGYVFLTLGDPAHAADDFREGLFAFRRIEDQNGQLDAYNCLARCAFMLGHYQRAKEYLEGGVELCKETGDADKTIVLGGNFGRILTLLGDFKAAASIFMKDLEGLSSLNSYNLSSRLLSIAYLSLCQHEFSKTHEHLERARAIAVEHSLARQLALYCEYAGELAFWQGDRKLAEEHYREGLRIGVEIAPEGDLISQIHRLLGELQVEQGKFAKAAESCDRAWRVAEKINERLELGAIQRVRGEIAARRGDASAAKAAFDESIRILGEIGAKYELARAHLQAGEAKCLDSPYRMINLALARSLFETIGVAWWQERVAAQIDRLIHADVGRNSWSRETGRGFDNHRTPDGNRSPTSMIVTQDKGMLELIALADRIKDSDMMILLQGETGTGKDLLAEYIHCTSKRSHKPFRAVNCAAIPESLLESELFGVRKGTFTGADRDKTGLIQSAEGGTFYFDEIGEAPAAIQAKLLRVIETKMIRCLGSTQDVRVDIRFLAASSADLTERMRQGKFREDLYYRLQEMVMSLPPLRDRPGDLPLLFEHFLLASGFPPHCLEGDVVAHLLSRFDGYAWPGNVRELKLTIGRAAARVYAGQAGGSIEKLMEELSHEIAAEGSIPNPEREKLIALLEANDWNQRQTAREMGIGETTIRRLIERLKISRPVDR